MKNVLAFGLTMIMATSALASTKASKITEANEKLAITGFQILEDSDSLLKLKFRDEDKAIILSKEKFSSEKDAKAFCEKNSASLDSDALTTALHLAMSGAGEADERIKSAVSFSFTVQGQTVSGIWAWTANDTVTVLQDGRGLSEETTPIAELIEASKQVGLPEMALVPAICK